MRGNSWFDRVSDLARLRLFCFASAGSGSAAFRNWPQLFPATVAICPVHIPGRERRIREPLRTDAVALAEEIAEAMREIATRPFALFGHSLGALLAFETARALRRSYAVEPEHLFVAACPAPQYPIASAVHNLNDNDFVGAIMRFGASHEEVWRHHELRNVFLPVLRADFTMYERYRYHPEAPFRCPLTAFGGSADRELPQEALDAWAFQTSIRFRSRVFSGGHFFLHEQEKVMLREIASDLSETIVIASQAG